jgi:hypothetical protein
VDAAEVGVTLTRRKKVLFALLLTLGPFLVTCAAAEVVLRLKGHRPWRPVAGQGAVRQDVEPGGTLYRPDDRLGYVLLPGAFTVKQRTVTFRVTHGEDGRRAVRTGAPPSAPQVWLFGDSYTYGWAVEDADTYAWKLQAARPELAVTNFGVGGYSNVQSLIQLEAELAAGRRPALVVLAYASFHDGRNMLLSANRKGWMPFVSIYPAFPSAWLDGGELRWGMKKLEYDEFPLERSSALMNYLADKWNKLEVVRAKPERVTEKIILKMRELAESHGAKFLLAGIYQNDRTRKMLEWAASQGVETIDLSVDQRLPENVVKGDGHPSPAAHSHYAKTLGDRILGRNP